MKDKKENNSLTHNDDGFESVLKLHRIGTYIRVKNKHLFFGFDKYESKLLSKALVDPKGTCAIHIFIARLSDINPWLNNSVLWLLDEIDDMSKVVIHVPKKLKDLRKILDKTFEKVTDIRFHIISEKVLPSFAINDRFDLDVVYDGMYINSIVTVTAVPTMEVHEDRAIQNEAQAAEPGLFKSRIIRNFKAITPLSILKSFKNEDDIWDYIIQQGEWKKENRDIKLDPITLEMACDIEDPQKYVRDCVSRALINLGINIEQEGD